MKIRKGDNVIIVSGKDRGKSGKVARCIPGKDLIVVERVNMTKKHQRPTRSNQKGQIVEKAMPFHVSNAMITDPESGKPSRIGKKLVGDTYVRISKKSGAMLEK